MGKLKKYTRRTFLVGSAAIVGGVAFGTYKTLAPAPNPLVAGPGEAALNPFVFIDQSGITLIAPRAEMGQGVRTSWAALIAEELDVELDQVRVLHGPAARAYYNSALLVDGMPMRFFDSSEIMIGLAEAFGKTAKLVAAQVTGGSTSMRDGFERMRAVGASARETLKQAAAQRLGVARDRLETRAGRVIAPDGREIPYADLAEAAAGIDPPRHVPLRPASEWRLIGRSQPRVDMVAKSTGTAKFGIDTRLEGMKFATIRMSPRFGAGMLRFDATRARAMPGVEKVIDLGTGIAVVATNTWLAMQAAEAVEITWGDPVTPPDTAGVFAEIERAFDARPDWRLRKDGDVTTLPPGAREIRAEYQVPFLAHATMEPMNATAHFTGDRLRLWSGNQAPTLARWKCARAAGLDQDAVEVITPYLGGGFGRRGEVDFSVLATRVAVEMPGVPVQVTWSRAEDMRHDFYRPGAIARMRGAVRDGAAVLLDGAVAAQSPLADVMGRMLGVQPVGPDKALQEGLFNQPYAIPNYRMSMHIAKTGIPVGFWRSVANSHNAFFHECFLDEMAREAGTDPLEFRLDLIRKAHEPSALVIEKLKEISGWGTPAPERVGRGMAFAYSFGSPVAQAIEISRNADGRVRLEQVWIVADTGFVIDPSITEAQLISGAIYGLSAAIHGEITFADGMVEQENFPDYEALRMPDTPRFSVALLENNDRLGGVGEIGTPPAAPALANAVFDLTGQRLRRLPLGTQLDFA